MMALRQRAALCTAALLAGGLGALGQAPYDQPLFFLAALVAGMVLWRSSSSHRFAGAVGWALGTGYFAFALLWIVEPFQVDVDRHGWMAPFALLFLSGGLALFWAAAFWAARRVSRHPLALAFTWSGAELLRAYVLTGFPWASPAQVLVDGPASRMLAAVGPHGATLCLMLLAAALATQAQGSRIWMLRIGQGALVLAGALALYLPLARVQVPDTGKTVRLVQPNAAQHLKWRPENAEVFLRRQLELTAAAPGTDAAKPDLIVWPETAIPWRLETAGPVLADIALAAGGAPVVLGVLRTEGAHLRNSMVVIDSLGAISAVYDKHHLVPFGEYIPFASVARRLGLRGLVEQGVGFAPGPGPQVIDFGPLGRAVPLICYEAVFAHDVGAVPERPDFLLQVTNDAWFGTYAGPQQHLAQARMRAIEQGLPMLRAANTGISAAIDPYGRVIASLPLGTAGFVDTDLPVPLAPTLYSRTGDKPAIAIVLLGLAVLMFRASMRAPQKEIDRAGRDT